MKLLNLISGPRNISTALMYSFAQRYDTQVWDEPFYALYLEKSGADHPGKDEVLLSQPIDEQEAKRQIMQRSEKPIVFIKNMAHHMELMEEPFLPNSINIFLIRDPRQIISSYVQVIERPTMRDIGIAHQFHLYESQRENSIVIDSAILLQNPKGVLTRVCTACEIPFQESMLHWASGPKPYDGVWAKHWYMNVHNSTGLELQKTSQRHLPEHLVPLYEQARHYYEILLPFSIKA